MSYLAIYTEPDDYDIDLADEHRDRLHWALKLLNALVLLGILALVGWSIFTDYNRAQLEQEQYHDWRFEVPGGTVLDCKDVDGSMECESAISIEPPSDN
jgi:hypothetical protein